MAGLAKLTIPTTLYFISNEYTFGNLFSANAASITNVLTTNVTASGNVIVTGNVTPGSLTFGVNGNVFISNAVTTTNIFSETVLLSGFIRVGSNIYNSNTVTTNNVFARGQIVLNGGGGAIDTTTLTSTDNIRISNSILTTNVWCATLATTGAISASGLPGITTMYLSGNAYVANAVTTTNVLATGNVIATGNVFVGGANNRVSANMFVSNSITTGNVFASGEVIGTQLVSYGNIVTLNAFVTTNIFSSNVIAYDGYASAEMLVSGGNATVSNTITTTTVWTTNVYGTGDMIFAGLAGKTTVDVTGNVYAANAVTTTNVWCSNIYASGKVSFAGLPGLTTLYASSNVTASNAVSVNNVWSTNLSSATELTISGTATLGIQSLGVTGNSFVTHTLVAGNVYASGNIYVTADSQRITGNNAISNALVTANLWASSTVNAGVGAYMGTSSILTDPTLGALAATVYTNAGQGGAITRTGHMPMYPELTTAPTGVWSGDTYFDNNFLYKYTTSAWRRIELLYPTALPAISAVSTQVGSLVGQTVVPVNQTVTPFSSLGTVRWTVSGAPTGTYLEGGSNAGCFIIFPISSQTLAGSFTVTVGASNERGSATNQSFALTMPSPGLYVFPIGSSATFSSSQSSAAQNGPTLVQARSAMSGSPTPSNWNTDASFFTTDANGIQKWTVPISGTYSIDSYGAAGGIGQNCTNQRGGYGSRVYGVFSLTRSQVINVVPGRKGTDSTCGWGGGGGGGSFAWLDGQTVPYIAAGGGGGGSGYQISQCGDAPNSTNGNQGEGACNNVQNGGAGGSNGNAGAGGSCTGPGGQGWYGGVSAICGGSATWTALYTNPQNPHGGWCNASGWGGFGGGGSSWGGAGGGGGYSGGGGSGWAYSGYGGGGGRYNAGSSQSFGFQSNSGEGFVTITRMT